MASRKPFKLNQNYITGVSIIDRQHANLINLVNEASRSLHKDASPARLSKIVKELLSYAIYHFNTEEVLMKRYGYLEMEREDAEAHIQEHRAFSEHIIGLQEKIYGHAYIDTDELIDYLLNWIGNHTLETDKKLSKFILQQDI
ncbi:MAG: hemerythrin family protein [Gammaproteobacteria bacterium]|nr:hemerythrin family protein [Gammaproteobacteria bacterium]